MRNKQQTNKQPNKQTLLTLPICILINHGKTPQPNPIPKIDIVVPIIPNFSAVFILFKSCRMF